MSDPLPISRPSCDPFIVVRRYGPHGNCPRFQFVDPEALFVGGDGEAYSAVVVGDAVLSGRISLESELAWIFPHEIRLVGAIALSQHPDWGKLTLYLDEEYETLPLAPYTDLTAPGVQRAVLDAVSGSRLTRPIDPLHLVDSFDVEDFRHLFEGLRLSSPLMLRGIAALLKSSLLGCHRLFGEEAALLCFISLEAALELIRARLTARYGLASASFADAFNYVDQIAGYPLGEFFEDCHDLRSQVVHPKPNRAEMSWVPRLQADDFCDTYEAVLRLYRHLILGEKFVSDWTE